MGKGTKDPRKPSAQYLASNPGSTSQIPTGVEAGKKSIKSKTSSSSTANEDEDILRKVIRELGGDDEDYDLVKGVDDDAEMEEGEVEVVKGKGKSEKELKEELTKFLKGLDFKSVVPEGNVDEDEEVEEEEEEEEDEDEEDEDEEDEEEDEDDEEEEEEEEAEEEELVEDEEVEEDDKEEEEEVRPAPILAETKPEVPEYKMKSGLQVNPDSRSDNIPQTPIWYHIPLPSMPPSTAATLPLPPHKISTLQTRANALLASLSTSKITGKSSSDTAFLSQILSDGTHQDKLSALILLVRESPIHRMAELERLRSMAGWSESGMKGGGGREEKVAVMRGLADWWVGGGGKEQGKLRYFADQPLLAHPAITDRHLVMFAFEDWLKKFFFSILQILESCLHDTLPFVRTQALTVTFKLLAGNAEQEQNLLRLGVNKLGDTDKSVASKTSHHILVLLQTHPAMKAVIVREVASLVLKAPAVAPVDSKRHNGDKKGKGKGKAVPHVEAGANHGRYYGLITLNQVTLTVRDRDVAARLVEVYFEIFRELLDTDMDQPAPADLEEAEQQNLEKITGKVSKWQGRRKGTKFTKGKGQQHEEEIEQGDSKMISAVLTGVNRAMPFAKLDDTIFTKHAETLFRITHVGTFNTSIRALMLIHQVASAKEAVSDRFYRTLYQSMLDPRLTESSKQAMYLNLLFKAIKADTSLGRVMAFVKRLLQVMTLHQPPFICGAMYLLGELFSTTPGLRTLLNEPEDNGVENFKDAEDGDRTMEVAEKPVAKPANSVEYDGRKRDPQHANARGSCLWELIPFVSHYHPSVSLQATQLLSLNLPLSGSSDISQNTLISFLDRFVYRNPKKHAMAKGASIMQPAAVSNGAGLTVVKNRGPRVGGDDAVGAGYVNDEKFWKKKVQDVPADQLFFHKYFNLKIDKQKAVEAQAAKRKKGKRGDSELGLTDDEEEEEGVSSADEAGSSSGIKTKSKKQVEEDEESDPEEAEIWKAMQNSMPQTFDEDDDLLEDSGSDDMEEDDEGLEFSDEEDEDEDGKISDDDSDDDNFPMEEDSDDLLSVDEMPDIPLGTGEDDEDEAPSEDEETSRKRKRRDEQKDKRKKRKALPLLASAEDYAALIDAADEENL